MSHLVSKRDLYILTFIMILILSPLRGFSYNLEDTIVIEVISLGWPPNCLSHPPNTSFSFWVHVNITNHGSTKYVTTCHSDLFRTYMIVDLEGFYQEIEIPGMGFCAITGHVIETGVSFSSTGMFFTIPNCTILKVPPGNITIWCEFDLAYSYPNPYTFISPNRTFHITEVGTISGEEPIELHYNGFMIISSLIVMMLIISKRKQKHKEL
ncbi:MAG: hypothetical protein ACTSQF_12265 [Candidatus Heimdallarchaeaceae archaeon]